MKSAFRKLAVLIMLFSVIGGSVVYAQQKKEKAAENTELSSTQQRALLLINQQIDEAGKLESVVSRIAITIRAADTLWDFQQDNARKAYTDAYDLAVKHFSEKGSQAHMEGKLTVSDPDQRFLVLGSIARHDPQWAQRLSKQLAAQTKEDADKAAKEGKPDSENRGTPTNPSQITDKLLGLVMSLLDIDHKTAIDLFRTSLQYPASYSFARVLYRIAKSDQVEADQLCREAIAAYANGPLESLFYVSVYPFRLTSPIAQTSITTAYSAPEGMIPNAGLQQMFLDVLLRRGESSIDLPDPTSGLSATEIARLLPGQRSEKTQIYVALSNLEPVVAQSLPAFLERVTTLKTTLSGLLSADQQRQASGGIKKPEADTGNAFEKSIDSAEQQKDPGRKDYFLAQAIIFSSESESVERIEKLADKISDPNVRQQVMDSFYFQRSKKLLKDGLLDEAAAVARKIQLLDYRANALLDIAAESIKRNEDRARAAEVLNAIELDALKAPNTIEKGRTLLGIAHLFAQFDQIRAVEVMDDAVKSINQISASGATPDFSKTSFNHRIEGKQFGIFANYQVSGFSLENAFAETAPFDFDGVLLIARKLDDKVLRAQAIIAISAGYLKTKSKTAA